MSVPVKFKAFVGLSIYLTIAIPSSIYYGYHFSRFVHSKGAEIFNYILVLLVTNLLFNIVVWWSTEFNVLMRLISPFIICFVAFTLGIGILDATDLRGIPRHLIFVYGGCHLSIFTFVTFALAFKLGKLK